MNKVIIGALLSCAASTWSMSSNASSEGFFEQDFSGNVGLEWREYKEPGQYDRPHAGSNSVKQADRQVGVTLEPEYVMSLADGAHTLVFKPYYRYDSADEARSHGDIRELSWLTYGDDWELVAGISKVYWGVTESQHLVDIVNQTDFVEAPDGEEKLGQPMIKLSLQRDWGSLDGFILPGFRERTFSGVDGRFRPELKILGKSAYQAGEGAEHIDAALRWSHTLDDYDLGLSYFQGTSRDPLFIPARPVPALNGLPTALTAFYPLIKQASLDAQATLDAWLWKLEVISRHYDDSIKRKSKQPASLQEIEDYQALTGGFEYTYYAPFADSWGHAWDVGVLAEYQYDSREDATRARGQNDLFVGSRIAFNDTASSEFLAGISQDLDHQGVQSLVMELATRLGGNCKLSVDVWILESPEDDNVAVLFKRDDFVQASLNYYF